MTHSDKTTTSTRLYSDPAEDAPDPTESRGRGAQFPPSRWTTLIDPARHDDEKCRELLKTYYPAMVSYMAALASAYRLSDEAEDLTNEFIHRRGWLESRFLDKVRRGGDGGTFRGFLKRCLKNFLLDQLRRRGREIPESEVAPEGLPEREAETEQLSAADLEFARRAWDRCIDALRTAMARRGRGVLFEAVLPRLEGRPDAPSYAELVEQLARIGVDYREGALRKAVADLRASFRALFLEQAEELVDEGGSAVDEALYLLTVLGREALLGTDSRA